MKEIKEYIKNIKQPTNIFASYLELIGEELESFLILKDNFDVFKGKTIEVLSFMDHSQDKTVAIKDFTGLEFEDNVKLYSINIDLNDELVYICSPDSVKEKISKLEMVLYDHFGNPSVKSISDICTIENLNTNHELDALHILYNKMVEEYKESTKKVDVIYIDEETFESKVIKFEKTHFNVAEIISKCLKNELFKNNIITPVLCNKEGDKLCVGVIPNRELNKENSPKYRIVIEKV